MKHLLSFASFLLLMCLLLPAQPGNISLQTFSTGFNGPVAVTHAGDERLFVVEQDGYIYIVDQNGTKNPFPFLDIDARVNSGANERGLLGLAFHPNYQANGYFYVNYTNSSGASIVSRFSVSANPDVADATSEDIMMTVNQPFSNHNGGCIKFGHDGYLYISLGDGGSGGDPGNRSQDGQELLGKMLRIDVDNGLPYTIPANNPHVGNAQILDEIWAIGLRNAWRFSFDKVTGDMWIGDVGQNAVEEIDFWSGDDMVTSAPNFGWRCYEGNAAYNTSGCNAQNTYDPPVYTFPNGSNHCSVTGGYTYRGARYGSLWGYYFHTDYCSGWFWYTVETSPGNFTTTQISNSFGSFDLVGFGEDIYGEMYVCGLGTGRVYKLADTTCTPKAFISMSDSIEICGTPGNLEAYANPSLTYQWQLNGADIPGATMATHNTGTDGNYRVIVSNGSCKDTSANVYASFVPGPTAMISGLLATYCVTEGPQAMTGSPAGGTFSGPGVAGTSFDPSAAGGGTHAVVYHYDGGNGCVDTDTVMVFVDLCNNIDSPQLLADLSFYPNPGTGEFHVRFSLDAQQEIRYRVMDLQGRVLLDETQDFATGDNAIDFEINDAAAGMYFLKMQIGDEELEQKFVLRGK